MPKVTKPVQGRAGTGPSQLSLPDSVGDIGHATLPSRFPGEPPTGFNAPI